MKYREQSQYELRLAQTSALVVYSDEDIGNVFLRCLLRSGSLSNVNSRESVVLDRLCALQVLIDGLRVGVVDVMALL